MRFKHLHSQVKQFPFAVFSVLLSTCTESPSSVNPLGNMRFREPTGFVQYSESRSGPVFSVAVRQVIFSFRPSANQVERNDIQNWLISQGARKIGLLMQKSPPTNMRLILMLVFYPRCNT